MKNADLDASVPRAEDLRADLLRELRRRFYDVFGIELEDARAWIERDDADAEQIAEWTDELAGETYTWLRDHDATLEHAAAARLAHAAAAMLLALPRDEIVRAMTRGRTPYLGVYAWARRARRIRGLRVAPSVRLRWRPAVGRGAHRRAPRARRVSASLSAQGPPGDAPAPDGPEGRGQAADAHSSAGGPR